MGHLLLGRRARSPRTRVYPRGHFFFGHNAHYEKQNELANMLQCCVLIAKAQKHDMSNQMEWMKPNSVKLEGFLSLFFFDDV